MDTNTNNLAQYSNKYTVEEIEEGKKDFQRLINLRMEGFVKRGLPGAVLSSLLVVAALKRTNLTGMRSNLLSIGGTYLGFKLAQSTYKPDEIKELISRLPQDKIKSIVEYSRMNPETQSTTTQQPIINNNLTNKEDQFNDNRELPALDVVKEPENFSYNDLRKNHRNKFDLSYQKPSESTYQQDSVVDEFNSQPENTKPVRLNKYGDVIMD